MQAIAIANTQEPIISETDLVVIEQLPVITERFKILSDEIDAKTSEALALDCTESSVKTIKTLRATLNKEFAHWDGKRKEVKTAIMAPYERFESVFDKLVGNKLKEADQTLKKRIDAVENAVKKEKAREIKSFFDEYLASQNIDFLTFERWNPNVTLSVSLKALKDEARAYIDRAVDDLALIETQEYRDEIIVEYKASLNVSQAIATVIARHRAIEEQKRIQAEQEARRAAEKERIAKVEAAIPTQVAPNAPPTSTAPLPPPVQVEPEVTVAFKVTGTMAKLSEFKKFLTNGGYKYE